LHLLLWKMNTDKQSSKIQRLGFFVEESLIVFVFALSVTVMQHTLETVDDLCELLFSFFLLCNDPNKLRQLCFHLE
jgi:hypothetical protein